MSLERARNHSNALRFLSWHILLINKLSKGYPNYLLYCISAFFGTIAVCQFLSFLHTKLARTRNGQNKTVDPEGGSSNYPTRSWSRLPLALINVYRVFAFRHTVELGSYRLNFAEVFITIAYILLLLLWSFVNCKYESKKYHVFPYFCLSMLSSHISRDR
jgi:ferric-chelate reductase